MDYDFKVLDLMFMDDFIMFRCTLECWDQLRNVGTSLRNQYRKIWRNGENQHPSFSKRHGERDLKHQRAGWGTSDAAHHTTEQTEVSLSMLACSMPQPFPQVNTDFSCSFFISKPSKHQLFLTEKHTIIITIIIQQIQPNITPGNMNQTIKKLHQQKYNNVLQKLNIITFKTQIHLIEKWLVHG